jgi:RecA/RadA recombinase
VPRNGSDDIKKELTAPRRKRPFSGSPKDFLGTGSTLLNLACTGLPNVGIQQGTYVLIAGHSDAGKTILGHTILAEAAINLRYKDYDLIMDAPERGNTINVKRSFPKLAERLEVSASSTVEEFYYGVDTRLKSNKSFVMVLDSMDSLDTEADQESFDARKEGKDAQSYGTAKAKSNSANLRTVANRLANSGSILVIIAQLHQNIGFDARFNPNTISGGKALRYYANLLLWMTPKGAVKKTVGGKDREQGISVEVAVKKNRLSGWKRSVEFDIYHSLGLLDDIGSCVDFLVDEKRWPKSQGKITAKDFSFSGTKEQIVQHVRKEGLQSELRTLVAETWDSIEQACRVDRDNPYQ